jgi:hypothetical protein
MEALLNNTGSMALQAWQTSYYAALNNDCDFVVTNARHYKSPFQGYQHEFIVLNIQPHPSNPQPPWSRKLLYISRSKGRLQGLKFDANDRVGVIDISQLPTSSISSELHWSGQSRLNAPPLGNILRLINCIHNIIPHYSILLDSCYTFSAAVLVAIHTLFDGTQQWPALRLSAQLITVRKACFFGVIPTVAILRDRWVI